MGLNNEAHISKLIHANPQKVIK